MTNKPSFRIFKMVKGKKKVVHTFESDNYETAYIYFQDYFDRYLKEPDCKDKYYFEIIHEYIGPDGKKYDDLHKFLFDGPDYKYDKECRYYDISKIKCFKKSTDIKKIAQESKEAVHKVISKSKEMLDYYQYLVGLLENTDIKTAPEEQMDEITRGITKFYDLEHDVENYTNMINDKHQISEYWSIDYHMLEDLKYNIPLLIKKGHTYPAYYDEKVKGTNKKPWDLWKEDLKELLLNVNLYLYYKNYGHIDNNDKQLVAVHKKYKDTIPIYPGTKRDIDYTKLYELMQKHWNYVWDWIKEYGQALWD